MRISTLFILAFLFAKTASGQTIATFTSPTLPTADTYYVNYTAAWGADVGFNDGLAHFPCYFDTSSYTGTLDTFWEAGFVYSNWVDSASLPTYNADTVFAQNTGKSTAAKTGIGYNSHAQYATVNCYNPATYGFSMNVELTDTAIGHPVSGFYITNTTYTYNSMKYGDEFDTAFQTGDWFLLTVKGYLNGEMTTDSVNFYLADYRSSNPDSDYIVTTWQWVNLLPIGPTDSLQFSLSSSNNTAGSMDVPAYFCMANFTTDETGPSAGVHNVQQAYIAKVYPNPASGVLNVDVTGLSVQQLSIMDMAGNVSGTYPVDNAHTAINIADLAPGMYNLQLYGQGKTANAKFVKQ